MIAQSKDSQPFELVMCLRNAEGKKTDKKKSFTTDSSYKLWEFFEKSDVSPRKKKGLKVDSSNPDEILKAAGEYAEKKQENRDKLESQENNNQQQ
jgi:hypothetical protein